MILFYSRVYALSDINRSEIKNAVANASVDFIKIPFKYHQADMLRY